MAEELPLKVKLPETVSLTDSGVGCLSCTRTNHRKEKVVKIKHTRKIEPPVFNRNASVGSAILSTKTEELYEQVQKVIPAKQLRDWGQAFNLFDKNGNGTIDRLELDLVLRSQGKTFTAEEIDAMKDKFDIDGDGVIDFDEFIQMMAELKAKQTPHDELKEAFLIFDEDRSGFIDSSELQECLLRYCDEMTLDDVTQLMQYADKNGDGKIDYDEFISFMVPDADSAEEDVF